HEKPRACPATARTQNRGGVLSEPLVEHVEPGHVRRIQSTRHYRFHCQTAFTCRALRCKPSTRLCSRVRRGGVPHDAPMAPASQAAPKASTAAARPSRGSNRAFVVGWQQTQNGASREGRRWISASLGSDKWASTWLAGWSRRATAW